LAKAFLIDIGGTVASHEKLYPGVAEWLAGIQNQGKSFLLLTNTTIATRSSIQAFLKAQGLDLDKTQILNPETAAFHWLANNHPDKRLQLVLPAKEQNWSQFNLVNADPEVILLGDMGEGMTRDLLKDLMQKILDGARLVALHKSRYWQKKDELDLDLGAFVALLEYATGTDATIIGKPSPDYFKTALAILNVSAAETTMIGDDLESDAIAAINAGIKANLVQTGKFRSQDRDRARKHNISIYPSLAHVPV
jgi:HAD superfamily hydrolase (TIGR01458 family)